MKKIKSIEPKVKDSVRRKQLQQRKSDIKIKLESVYKEAVDDFVNENYSDAIKGFQNVVAVDSGYKDAENYLEEAKAKEKIMKSY